MEPLAIGIDLGTTYTCAAYIDEHNKAVIIRNELGHTTMPSYVSFQGNHRVVGNVAKTKAFNHLENTVFDAKRMIGRNFNDRNIQQDLKLWPFKVVNHEGRPKIEVSFCGERKSYWPEQISAMVLEQVKKSAENCLGRKVGKAVIGVPAYFNHLQRQATIDAGRIAGLEVLALASEPSAAAQAYGLDVNSRESGKNYLLVDLGGGTLDISVFVLEEGAIDVKSNAGDTHLGGQDFDNRLVDHFLQEIKRKHNCDLSNNKRAIHRLRNACETCKHELSFSESASISLDGLFNGQDFISEISRAAFEYKCDDLLKKTIEHVQSALQQSHLAKQDIHKVVLAGGSTRIPALQRLLIELFEDANKLIKTANLDEVVAHGAALKAHQLLNRRRQTAVAVREVHDVVNLSLGIKTVDGGMSILIAKDTKLPVRRTKHFTTVQDKQQSAVFEVYQGERTLARDNFFLDKITFDSIRERPCGEPDFTITLVLNEEGTLKVTAYEDKHKPKQLVLNSLRTPEEVERMITDAERNRDADERERTRLEHRRRLEARVFQILKTTENVSNRALLNQKGQETLNWLADNLNCSNNEADNKVRELEGILASLKIP